MDKKLFSNSIVFTILTFLQPLSSFLILPIYLSHLSTEEYAVFSLMNNVTAFISIVAALGLGSSMINFYFNFQYNTERLKNFLGSVINLSILSSVVFFVIMLFIGPLCFQIFFKSSTINYYPLGCLSVGIGCLTTVSMPYLIFLKNDQKIWRYALIIIIGTVITVLLQILSLTFLSQKTEGLLSAKLIGTAIPAVVIVFLEFDIIGKGINFLIITPSIRFALRYLPTTILAWLNSFFDRFIIENLMDLKKLGIYSLLLTFTSMIEMFYLAIGNAVQPVLYRLFSEAEKSGKLNIQKVNQVLKFYFHAVLFAVSCLIILTTNLELFLTNPDYLSIKNYVSISCLSFFVYSYVYMFVLNIFYFKKTKLMIVVNAVALLSLVILDIILIPHYGLMGAVFVMLFSKFVLLLYSYRASQKVYRIQYDKRNLFVYPSLIFSGILMLNYFANNGLLSWNMFGLIQFLFVLTSLLVLNRTSLSELIKFDSKPN